MTKKAALLWFAGVGLGSAAWTLVSQPLRFYGIGALMNLAPTPSLAMSVVFVVLSGLVMLVPWLLFAGVVARLEYAPAKVWLAPAAGFLLVQGASVLWNGMTAGSWVTTVESYVTFAPDGLNVVIDVVVVLTATALVFMGSQRDAATPNNGIKPTRFARGLSQ